MADQTVASEAAPASPCVGICLIDPATRRCRGCLRYIDEIATWYDASAAEKYTILARLAERRWLDQATASEDPE
jgi:uncharacterized protein